MFIKCQNVCWRKEWKYTHVSHPSKPSIKNGSETLMSWNFVTGRGKNRGDTSRYRHMQGLSKKDSNPTTNSSKYWQMGLCEIKKRLHSREINQQDEERGYRMGRTSCQPHRHLEYISTETKPST